MLGELKTESPEEITFEQTMNYFRCIVDSVEELRFAKIILLEDGSGYLKQSKAKTPSSFEDYKELHRLLEYICFHSEAKDNCNNCTYENNSHYDELMEQYQYLVFLTGNKYSKITIYSDWSGNFLSEDIHFYFFGLEDLIYKLGKHIEEY